MGPSFGSVTAKPTMFAVEVFILLQTDQISDRPFGRLKEVLVSASQFDNETGSLTSS